MILEIPALPFLSMKSKQGPDAFSERPHTHKELSIGIILHGSSCVTIEGLDFDVNAGDLIIIPSDLAHLCIPSNPDRFNFHMAYFDPTWLREQTGIEARYVSAQAVPAPDCWKDIFDRLSDDRDLDSIENELINALGTLSANQNAVKADQDKTVKNSPAPLDKVHRMIMENPAHTLSIEEMASEAGMSKYDFLRKYSCRYGLTPHSSLTDVRIRKSLSLMRKNGSLTDIALDCGFSDQSHFIRQFKRYTGILPSEYRKAISSNRNTAESS